jgi:hypothetical protein
MEYAILTKSDHWKYEQEWRLVKPEHAGQHLQFEAHSLVGLIFGCRTTKHARRRIQRWIAESDGPNIALFEAKRADNAFALKIAPVSESVGAKKRSRAARRERRARAKRTPR